MDKIVLLIPAFNPKQSFIRFIEDLLEYPFKLIVIVNDGSAEASLPAFARLEELPGVTILTHALNEGKGSAIKTGLNHILSNTGSLSGVITCGADGQHQIADIVRLASNARLFSSGIILGIRDFKSVNLPKFSYLTNRTMSMLFELFFHKRLFDLQTGLRYLPRRDLSWLKSVPGKKYNYDTNMLIEAIKRKVPIYEVPIGKAHVSRNSFLHYDELMNPKVLTKQLLIAYLKNRETL